VALDVNRKVDPILEIDKTHVEWNTLTSFVQSAFFREEETKAADLGTFLTPPPRDEQKKTSVTLSHLYQSSAVVAGRHVYYFESLKEYRKPIPSNDQSCNNVFFKGWILGNSTGDLRLVDAKIGWTDCEGRQDRIPLGLLAVDNQVFVITCDFGYEDESYSILKLSESGIHPVLKTQGGSC
jgi:hypothetical protein